VKYYEVLVASKSFRGDVLTYSSEQSLPALSVVSVPLRNKNATGFIAKVVKKPDFAAKAIKNHLSDHPLPVHFIELARWMADYYACSLGEALRQFAPAKPISKAEYEADELAAPADLKLDLSLPLTTDQKKAISSISKSKQTTTLLHGDTATGKTRVYLELAKDSLKAGRSVIILTPEIALTAQLEKAAKELGYPVHVFHSHLTPAARKKIWLAILEASEPLIVIGARSALFVPLRDIGLIVVDEAHEPAYKQDQSPRYHAARVASRLGELAGARVVLGTATPNVGDYYLAGARRAIVTMTQPAIAAKTKPAKVQIIDARSRSAFSRSRYLSNSLIDEINTTLSAKKQIMIYLNRRGSARLIMCQKCGWQALCPNCDLPLVYHGDDYQARCHSCGYKQAPPGACPECQNPDIIYKGAGTKTLFDELKRLFGQAKIARFDSDSLRGERLNEQYAKLHAGQVDIIVGTQVLAKGLDLPKLELVGAISADSGLALPDFSSEERSFQLLYQVAGRVGRGHGPGKVMVQTYQPDSPVISAALKRDYQSLYKYSLNERKNFKFPPFAYLLKLSIKRATPAGAATAAGRLKSDIQSRKLPVEVIGPASAFYGRRGNFHYWQVVIKSKDRKKLVEIARSVPADWRIDLDPGNLL
jgi:primosomal protein N' (replication factor Y)